MGAEERTVVEVVAGRTLSDLTRPEARERAAAALEGGGIVHLPQLGFEVADHERALTDPSAPRRWGGNPKATGRPSVLYYQPEDRLGNRKIEALPRQEVKAMMDRFANWSHRLVHALLPDYEPGLDREFTTFRPFARMRSQPLHIDTTLNRPTHGHPMLRVFSNVNGAGVPRVWQVGGHFEETAARFAGRLATVAEEPTGGDEDVVDRLGRLSPRAAYDHVMVRLRALISDDEDYQRTCPRRILSFPAGSTWLAITDVALHGALSGQHSLDQSYLVQESVLQRPERSSRRVLEGLTGRTLA